MRFSFRTVMAMFVILGLFFIVIFGLLTLATEVANQGVRRRWSRVVSSTWLRRDWHWIALRLPTDAFRPHP